MNPTRRSVPGRLLLATGAAVLVLAGTAATAAPQTLSGTVSDAATGKALEGARVLLVDEEGEVRNQTLSRGQGQFMVDAPYPGRWRLGVELMGYATLRSDPLDVAGGEWLVLDVALAVEAIPLDPVVVTARRFIGSADIQRFYDRRDRGVRSGIGFFIVREEIEQLSPQRPTDLLRRAPGLRVVRGSSVQGQGLRMASGCIPAIYIDGMRINRTNPHDSLDDFVTVMDIEGVEVYRGSASQVERYHDPRGCGLVLAWTQRGVQDPDSSFSWKTTLGVLGAIGLVFLLLR